jgi:phenylacetate-CoA ligase
MLKSTVTNRRTFDAFRTGPEVYSRWVEEWRGWRPRFLIGYASALAGVADFIIESGRRVEGVEAVFSTAEKLYPAQRERIAIAFDARVRDQYGSREIPSVASECTFGRMHVYQDSAFLELLPYDVSGLSRIVLTQLDNPVMPLIRYVNGDLGVWSGQQRCECGLQYPILDEITGRVSDLFYFDDGRVVHGEYFTHVMYNVDGVEAFQFYQGRDGDVTLYVQPRQGAEVGSLRMELDRVVQRLPSMLGASFGIGVRFVSEIPRHGQGKHRFTISDYRR